MEGLNISEFTSAVRLSDHGIWEVDHAAEISYPDEGNALCFELEDKSAWFQHRNQVILATVQTWPCKTPIFDVGGGNGYVSSGLKAGGFESVLIEPGPTGAKNALQRGLKNVICSTFQEARLRDNSVPAVGLFDTLEHIEDSIGFLRELYSKLTDNGRIYITVPAFEMLWSGEDPFAGHFRRYSRSTLSKELIAAGFKVNYCSYFFAALFVPLFLLRSLPYRLRGSSDFEMEKAAKEHSLGGPLVSGLIKKSFEWELSRIRKQLRIPFGTSCLAVASKS